MTAPKFEWRHANSDPGERVRVSGYSAESFDVLLGGSFLAMVKARGIDATPDDIVRAVLGALPVRAGEWGGKAHAARLVRPGFFPTFHINAEDVRAMEVVESTFRGARES